MRTAFFSQENGAVFSVQENNQDLETTSKRLWLAAHAGKSTLEASETNTILLKIS